MTTSSHPGQLGYLLSPCASGGLKMLAWIHLFTYEVTCRLSCSGFPYTSSPCHVLFKYICTMTFFSSRPPVLSWASANNTVSSANLLCCSIPTYHDYKKQWNSQRTKLIIIAIISGFSQLFPPHPLNASGCHAVSYGPRKALQRSNTRTLLQNC